MSHSFQTHKETQISHSRAIHRLQWTRTLIKCHLWWYGKTCRWCKGDVLWKPGMMHQIHKQWNVNMISFWLKLLTSPLRKHCETRQLQRGISKCFVYIKKQVLNQTGGCWVSCDKDMAFWCRNKSTGKPIQTPTGKWYDYWWIMHERAQRKVENHIYDVLFQSRKGE